MSILNACTPPARRVSGMNVMPRRWIGCRWIRGWPVAGRRRGRRGAPRTRGPAAAAVPGWAVGRRFPSRDRVLSDVPVAVDTSARVNPRCLRRARSRGPTASISSAMTPRSCHVSNFSCDPRRLGARVGYDHSSPLLGRPLPPACRRLERELETGRDRRSAASGHRTGPRLRSRRRRPLAGRPGLAGDRGRHLRVSCGLARQRAGESVTALRVDLAEDFPMEPSTSFPRSTSTHRSPWTAPTCCGPPRSR